MRAMSGGASSSVSGSSRSNRSMRSVAPVRGTGPVAPIEPIAPSRSKPSKSSYRSYTRRIITARTDDLARFRALLRARIAPRARVLHLGCGHDGSDIVRALPVGCVVHGLDRAECRYPGQSFARGDVARLPYASGCFDAVVCEYVLEHLADADRALAELSRVTRPGGALLALTPNLWSYKALVAVLTPPRFHRWAARTLRSEPRDASEVHETRYALNTRAAIWIGATTYGWTVRRFEYLNNGPTWFERMPVAFELGRFYHWLLDRSERLGPLRCGILLELERRDPTAWLRPGRAERSAGEALSSRRAGRARARSDPDRAVRAPAPGSAAPSPPG